MDSQHAVLARQPAGGVARLIAHAHHRTLAARHSDLCAPHTAHSAQRISRLQANRCTLGKTARYNLISSINCGRNGCSQLLKWSRTWLGPWRVRPSDRHKPQQGARTFGPEDRRERAVPGDPSALDPLPWVTRVMQGQEAFVPRRNPALSRYFRKTIILKWACSGLLFS